MQVPVSLTHIYCRFTSIALKKGMQALVVVNKIDRPAARPDFVVDKVFDLFCELGASDDQTDFRVVYASGLQGIAGRRT